MQQSTRMESANGSQTEQQIPLTMADGGSRSGAQQPMTRTALALLPPRTLVFTTELCSALGVTPRTLRRMVGGGALPPPLRIGGSNAWFAGAVLERWEEMAAEKSLVAQRRAELIAQAKP